MGKRTDLKKILIIGSGPIIIGQACEFDYSGSQACKALREEGYRVVLVNSNPATIMTDPQMADATYIEPLTPEILTQVIAKEKPDAILPTMGGQTGLNLTMRLAESGVLDKYHVECIGATPQAIARGEDRRLFKEAMEKAGLDLPQSGFARNLAEAETVAGRIGFPLVIRPSFTLGGTGGGIVYNRDEFKKMVEGGLELSLIHEVLVEESIAGWKEFELEVMRDRKDNVVIVCSIENLDPMGVHTGDSITVAPAQTLSDREYQAMRNAAIACIRAIGVDTGGSNVQFAVNPKDGRLVIIEMNPRVSRSSALASKATGFPIAKIAAKLAVGYTLDEIPNDITRQTPASFEPTIDYCVVKIPRFTFEKFPTADPGLTTSMKSVGEIMAIGRTFKEALGKGLRSLETGHFGLGADGREPSAGNKDDRLENLRRPTSDRIFHLYAGLKAGLSVEKVYAATGIDPWFLANLTEIIAEEKELTKSLHGFPFQRSGKGASVVCRGNPESRRSPHAVSGGCFANFARNDNAKKLFLNAKRMGFSDRQLAYLSGAKENEIRKLRWELGLRPSYKLVDTCAAEFAAATPYFYSTYETGNEASARPKSAKEKVIILGAGPNRIGQGIEFDYACVHASYALREAGLESIMINCNPETVSTDYDTSDRLYFEPLTLEDVLEVVAEEKPKGVIVQLGGQTPLNLALELERNQVPILGTKPKDIDRAEDRKLFKALIDR
ncbi:MAG: carbamoyl-phosphate synthase large subunit, partial [Candidatus Omnitrophota bacterium]